MNNQASTDATIAQHTTEIGQLGNTLKDIWGEIKENRRHSDANFDVLTSKLSSIGKANYPVLIGIILGFLSFAASLIVGGYFVIQLSISNSTSPVRAMAEGAAVLSKTNLDAIHLLNEKMARTEADRAVTTSRLESSLIEVETQFRAGDQVRNIQTAAAHRDFALLWGKVFPDIPYPTIVYYPTIAK